MRFSKYPLNICATSFDSEKSSQFRKNFFVEIEIEILESFGIKVFSYQDRLMFAQ